MQFVARKFNTKLRFKCIIFNNIKDLLRCDTIIHTSNNNTFDKKKFIKIIVFQSFAKIISLSFPFVLYFNVNCMKRDSNSTFDRIQSLILIDCFHSIRIMVTNQNKK